MAKIEIYTTGFCGYCARAKALLDRKGVAYQEYDAEHGSEARRQAIGRSGGRTTVPGRSGVVLRAGGAAAVAAGMVNPDGFRAFIRWDDILSNGPV